MKGARMSSLPIVQYCQAAGVLGESHGAGRAAAKSTVFHALAGNQPDAHDLLARLHPDERQEVLDFRRPTDIEVGGRVLKYAEAEHEITLGLDEDGEFTTAAKSALTIGHADCVWPAVDNVTYVADLKKTSFGHGGPTSLQCHAYGIAAARKQSTRYYCVGIWDCTEGEWDWGPLVDLDSLEGMAIEERVLAAAANVPEVGEGVRYDTGPHCFECYSRAHCQEWLLPVADPESALAPLAEPGGITQDNAKEALFAYHQAKTFLAQVKDGLEAFAHQNGGIRDGEGKVWRKTVAKRPGKKLDRSRLEQDHPELVQEYTIETPPRNMGFRWCNEEKR